MNTKPLLYGLIGFFAGGLLVSIAATTFDKPKTEDKSSSSVSNLSMTDMSQMLEGKTGDEYDKAFIDGMIAHHEGAVVMAKLSGENAKHDEIKKLSQNIITSQESEIAEMKKWQREWGYEDSTPGHSEAGH